MIKLLMITIGFSPNIGGIETHFDDFLVAAAKRDVEVTVLTYQPITSNSTAPFIERGKGFVIYRLPWFGGLFYQLVHNPILEFLYLLPGLFIFTPIILLIKRFNIDVIHAHGLIAGFVGLFWGKLFMKKVIISTHSIYNFPKSGLYRKFSKFVFANADLVLTLSKQSANEIKSLGVNGNKVKVFTYWIDLDTFKPLNKAKLKKSKGLEDKFNVLFVGRLVEIKGINELLQASKYISEKCRIIFIGEGPLEEKIKNFSRNSAGKVVFVGKIANKNLAEYYNIADLLIVPSINEEGFGRVILESLACGTPVIGSNKGAIPEAMDATVGKFIEVTPNNIAKTINDYVKYPDKLKQLSKNARQFAINRYSEDNVEVILQNYA